MAETKKVVTVSKSIDPTKEYSEIVDAIRGILVDLKAGKNKATDLMPHFGAIIEAAKGAELLGEEMKSEFKEDNIAYLIKQLAGVYI